MTKPELLSPAGNMESLYAAIKAGADAIYLGGYKFGARAFASNFSRDEMIEAINYAHLYGVKIYVTVNTLIYENEVEEFLDYVDFLYRHNVDALIIQDIGMLDLVRKTYPNLDIHASTQMHIHNLEGVKLVDSLGVKRCVIARETDFETIENIKKKTNIELEVFVHGALCISYSGQCLMSSLIGGRSGNLGSCAGSCRLKYDFIHNDKKLNKDNYLLSTKDLNSLENIGKLIDIGVDSFKLEGRMKSPSYVYMVTSLYRKAIDSYIKSGKVVIDKQDIKNLKIIFNRLFTKGFLFKEENNQIINPFRPNHQGIKVGTVIKVNKNIAYIKLQDTLSINDGIRFIGKKDSGLIVTSMFKDEKRCIQANAFDLIKIKVKEAVRPNDIVVKTTDYNLNREIERKLKMQNRKVLIKAKFDMHLNKPCTLSLDDGIHTILVEGPKAVLAKTHPITFDDISNTINKLGSTVYKCVDLKINMDANLFISLKELNELRREAVNLLNQARLKARPYFKSSYQIEVPSFKEERNYSILVNNYSEYEQIKDQNYQTIYIDNYEDYLRIKDDRLVLKLDRVMNEYPKYKCPLLVGEMGSLLAYKPVASDFSLNVTNSYAVALLHSMGIKKVTLSYEMNEKQISDLIKAYHARYKSHPNLEVIIDAYEEVMISKFNLNKYFNVDGLSYLRDSFNNMYPIVVKNNLMYIYNYHKRNLKNASKYFDLKVNNLRIIVPPFKEKKLP